MSVTNGIHYAIITALCAMIAACAGEPASSNGVPNDSVITDSSAGSATNEVQPETGQKDTTDAPPLATISSSFFSKDSIHHYFFFLATGSKRGDNDNEHIAFAFDTENHILNYLEDRIQKKTAGPFQRLKGKDAHPTYLGEKILFGDGIKSWFLNAQDWIPARLMNRYLIDPEMNECPGTVNQATVDLSLEHFVNSSELPELVVIVDPMHDGTIQPPFGGKPEVLGNKIKLADGRSREGRVVNSSELPELVVIVDPMHDGTVQPPFGGKPEVLENKIKLADGRSREGRVVDLNSDGIADVCWMWGDRMGETRRYLWLYVNLEGEWTLKWRFFEEECI